MTDYGMELVTAPDEEPVSLADAKAWLRLESDDDDTTLEGLVAAAREALEAEFGVTLVTTRWRLTLPNFPCWGVELPRGPVQSVASVKYVAQDGTLTTVSSGDYTLDTGRTPALLTPAYLDAWPSPRSEPRAVRIEYDAGYGHRPQVPRSARQAVLATVAWWYEHRGEEAGLTVPDAARNLMRVNWSGVVA